VALSWDWETRGVIDLKARGVYVYAQHPETDALIASYRLRGKGAAHDAWIAAGGLLNHLYRWKRGEPCPPWVRAYVEAGGEIVAHNAAFERLIWQHIMTPRHGWPVVRIEQFRCTAVTAAAMSLPRDLERLGEALDLKIKKDKRGAALMKIHSIPQKDGSWHPLADDPVSMEAYHTYCDFDILSEDEAADRLIPLSDEEMRVYWMNERINDKGLRIDVRSAKAALTLIDKAKAAIDAEISAVTGGVVTAVTQAARLKTWIESQGVVMPSMDKDDVDDFLHSLDDLPANVKRALELRQEGAKPSVEKIGGMLSRTNKEGRVQGVYLHHGAGQTGRFSSRGPLQAHNMPKYRKVFEEAHLDQNLLFDFIRQADPALLQSVYGPELGRPLHLLSDAVRGFIWADPGHDLLVADYSSIEGRMADWFAGEDWELDAYRAVDRGEGYGIYELNAAGIYGVPVELVTKLQRAGGKISVLACQYASGPGGIRKFARQNKVKLPAIYPGLWEAADYETREFIEKRLADRIAHHDQNVAALGREGWMAAEMIKVGWRNKHPKIVAFWKTLEDAAIDATNNPGQAFEVTHGSMNAPACTYKVAHGFLWCRLPSGRCLAYGKPKMNEVEAPWADKTLEPIRREKKLSLTVRGVDATTEKWVRFPVYGGSLFNNLVQGSARDVLVHGMFAAEERYGVLTGSTHDELFVEVPRGTADVRAFEKLICQLPQWVSTLPLTAAGFLSKRYKKA
jgi:DNA polymerase